VSFAIWCFVGCLAYVAQIAAWYPYFWLKDVLAGKRSVWQPVAWAARQMLRFLKHRQVFLEKTFCFFGVGSPDAVGEYTGGPWLNRELVFIVCFMVAAVYTMWLVSSREPVDIDVTMADLPRRLEELTDFQRYILGEVKARRGTLRFTTPNQQMARRVLHSTIREERPDIRGTDMHFHVEMLLPLMFIPSELEINTAYALTQPGEAFDRIGRLNLPPA
jgi:hypothetical protein